MGLQLCSAHLVDDPLHQVELAFQGRVQEQRQGVEAHPQPAARALRVRLLQVGPFALSRGSRLDLEAAQAGRGRAGSLGQCSPPVAPPCCSSHASLWHTQHSHGLAAARQAPTEGAARMTGKVLNCCHPQSWQPVPTHCKGLPTRLCCQPRPPTRELCLEGSSPPSCLPFRFQWQLPLRGKPQSPCLCPLVRPVWPRPLLRRLSVLSDGLGEGRDGSAKPTAPSAHS